MTKALTRNPRLWLFVMLTAPIVLYALARHT